MKKDIVFVKTNKYWTDEHIPLVTIITSNYNRREVLLRCMKSVDAQTYKDIEYIVVDNGSSVSFDDIMEQFMEEATIPVMFIKRNNGIGRHTGRNSAIRRARGEYLAMLDSDDEFLPNGIEKLVNAWMQIPEEKRVEYREVVGLCQDEKGVQLGVPFPLELNNMPKEEATAILQNPIYSAEHANMSRTILLKDNLFPEPEGVASYFDSIIWWKLAKSYKSYFINDIIKRYYTQSTDSITNTNKKGISVSANLGSLWSYKYYLNHWDEFDFPFKTRLRCAVYYHICSYMLKKAGRYPTYDWAKEPLTGLFNHTIVPVLLVPSYIIAFYRLRGKEFVK
jgi:glycosyltransferase involved in cell wall biosynthesis